MENVKVADVRAAGLRSGYVPGVLRSARTRYRRASWRTRLAVAVTVMVVGALGAALSGYSPLAGALVGAGVTLLLGMLLAAPETVKVAVVLLAYLPFASLLGYAYTAVPRGLAPFSGDVVAGTLSLMGMASALSVLALRYSRGAAWVTVALVTASTAVPGMLLLYVFPPMGVWAAWLPMMVVAAFRMGVWAWLLSWWSMRSPFTSQGPLPEGLSGVDARVVRLVKSPDGYAVVSSNGVAGVVVVRSTGGARETRRDGLSIPGVPEVDEAALKALRAATAAARLTGVLRQTASAILLVMGPSNADVDRWFGVHVHGDDGAAGAVRLMGESAFAAWTQQGSWPTRRVDRRAALLSRRVGRHRIK